MELEDMLSINLRLGVLASAVLIALGLILVLAGGGSILQPSSQFLSYAAATSSQNVGLQQTLNGAAQLQGVSFIFLGLMVLIATPIMRVLLSLISFSSKRNWTYAVITFIVLVNLIVSMTVIPGMIAH